MKRYGNLYPQVYDLKNIREAHVNARKGKMHYKEVIEVDGNPEYYFESIHNMLKNKTFRNSEYTIFHKFDSGKDREIYRLPYYPDRIIHHCIMQVIEPMWKKTLINDTFSSIKGRGIHKGVKRVKKALEDAGNTKYCLKFDIHKFYSSIDHNILKTIIRKKVKDKDLLWLLDNVIDSVPGIPIGNYLSQYFANLYLSGFDHWTKEVLRVKYYFRYCDDIIILDGFKDILHKLLIRVSGYLFGLKLRLKHNYRIFPTLCGIDFLGYVFFHDYTLVRRKIRDRCIKMLNKVNIEHIFKSIMSYFGWFIHCDSYNLRKSLMNMGIISRLNAYCKAEDLNNPLWRFI